MRSLAAFCAGVYPAEVQRGVDFALKQRRLGRSVLVHCAHGHGRSLEVLLACLVAAQLYKTYQEALTAVQAVRPKCKLNKMQRQHLETYLASASES
jgi:protein-tyrosine phosphatase